MQITIHQLLNGAKEAKGLTVIIDVFRAFSTACYLYDQGVERIIPVSSVPEAFELKKNNPNYILLGEVNEHVPEGFDFGNSPTLIKGMDFTGRTVVHRTSSGTQGLVYAKNATEVITGSFVNAPAIVEYIKRQNPEQVSLVCMGYATMYPTEEDTFCAEYIKFALEYQLFNMDEVIEQIKRTSGKRLFEPQNQKHSPSNDFYMCTDVGRFNFILKAEKNTDGSLWLRKIPIE